MSHSSRAATRLASAQAKVLSLQSEKKTLKASLDKAHKMLDNYLIRAANAERNAANANARAAAVVTSASAQTGGPFRSAVVGLAAGKDSSSEEDWVADTDGDDDGFEDAVSKSDGGLDVLELSNIHRIDESPERQRRELAVAKLRQAMSMSMPALSEGAGAAAAAGVGVLDVSSELFASHMEDVEQAHEHELIELKEQHSRELQGVQRAYEAAENVHQQQYSQLAQIQQVQNLMSVLGLKSKREHKRKKEKKKKNKKKKKKHKKNSLGRSDTQQRVFTESLTPVRMKD